MAVKVYLAGKISDPARAAWRDHLLTEPIYAVNRQYSVVNGMITEDPTPDRLTWPTAPNQAVLGAHDYVGPYLIDCTIDGEWDPKNYSNQAEEHGSRGWGSHGYWDGDLIRDDRIFGQCFAAVKRCDLVLAYLDGNDLNGTMIELGWAMALAKEIVLVTPMPVPPGEPIVYPLTPFGDLLAHAGLVFVQVHPDHLGQDLPDALEYGLAAVEAGRLATMPYPAYLKTAHWQDVRQRALGRAAGRCQLCGTAGSLDVHHNTYERRGKERPSDVIALCRSCHATHHGRMAR